MSIKRSRTVLHLAITENTALRVILYVAKDKINWYNDHGLHKLVIEALYPVILENLVRDPSKKLKEENRTIQSKYNIHAYTHIYINYAFTLFYRRWISYPLSLYYA
ncbi:uncharacterized protein B0P05DRAFT_524108 [Gilbertella persicaria]|uniref:uncharacterized protein n=1 Tax=Gilbertella persicaria TaxID=101096 RepID=UPI00221F054A|nr:uncharacterized protein B0P05DRAFT_524108 [Gilbertella persicaria]KAI8094958.1 hypothetical protein B0P05DRAFT_524108 [Gilbertella persicaria]